VISSKAIQSIVGVAIGCFVAIAIGLITRPVATDQGQPMPKLSVELAVDAAPRPAASIDPAALDPIVLPTPAWAPRLTPRLVAAQASGQGGPPATPGMQPSGPPAPAAAPPPAATASPAPTPSPTPTAQPTKPPKPPKPPKP
jgi:hypothetical protein